MAGWVQPTDGRVSAAVGELVRSADVQAGRVEGVAEHG
jgi:hypothetical protein